MYSVRVPIVLFLSSHDHLLLLLLLLICLDQVWNLPLSEHQQVIIVIIPVDGKENDPTTRVYLGNK